MPLLEGTIDHVIGVDTHRDTHAAAVLDPNGGVRAHVEVTADQAGHARLLAVAAQRAPGRRVWALEGTGSYGAGLAAFLSAQGEWVVEIDRPKRPRGRAGAKSDPLDAIRAGREALARDQLASPRQRGQREALRVLSTTRSQLVQVGSDARCSSKTAPPASGVSRRRWCPWSTPTRWPSRRCPRPIPGSGSARPARLMEYEPAAYLERISPTPLLMVVAAGDHLTPTDLALEAYQQAREPKRLVLLPGAHFDAYVNDFDAASGAARDWFLEHLGSLG